MLSLLSNFFSKPTISTQTPQQNDHKPEPKPTDTVAIMFSDIGGCQYSIRQYKRDSSVVYDEIFYLSDNNYNGIRNTTDQKAKELIELGKTGYKFYDPSISLYILDTANVKPFFTDAVNSRFGYTNLQIHDKKVCLWRGDTKYQFDVAMKNYPQ
jgi:hypothetical protein